MLYQWEEMFEYIIKISPALLEGAKTTVEIFLITLICSLPLGLIITFGSLCKLKIIRFVTKIYIWIFRGTPLMLQLFFFYYYISISTGITMTAFSTGVMTFILNYAAYFSEIFRGGIESIDVGQIEASKSLGLSKNQTMFGIILPQTIKRVLPAITNESIVLVKDTALMSVITVAELMKNSLTAVNRDVNVTALVVAAVFYLIFTLILTVLSSKLEKKYSNY